MRTPLAHEFSRLSQELFQKPSITGQVKGSRPARVAEGGHQVQTFAIPHKLGVLDTYRGEVVFQIQDRFLDVKEGDLWRVRRRGLRPQQTSVGYARGPHFKFTEAISFVVNCKTQEEVDELCEKLSEG
jgi:hypothetical protein